MAENTKAWRRRVIFQGRVQGVGFRDTTRRIAAGYHVRGYVRNQPDRSVELVVEGQKAELDRFCREVETRMADFIQDCRSEDLAASGEFPTFEIRW